MENLTGEQSELVGSSKQDRKKAIRNHDKPYVMLSKDKKNLTIIYKNKVMDYELKRTMTKKEIEESNGESCYEFENIYGKGWNKEHEAQILRNSGFHQVGLKDEESE